MKTFTQFLLELYQEEKDSTFENYGKIYNLNKIFKFAEFLPIKQIKTKDLTWEINADDIKTKDDKLRIKKADLSVPILLTKYQNKWLIVDGMHRLYKAINDKVESIPSKILSQEIMDKSLKKTK